MRAAVLTDHGEPLEIQEVDRPSPEPDQVVVETDACGICRSDWHAWRGDWDWFGSKPPEGQILGHEPAGTVVQVGEDVETVAEGDRVAIPFNLSDGSCYYCKNGMSNICEMLMPLGFTSLTPGAFAEEFPVRAADQNVVHLPHGVDSVDMAGLGCRFVTAFHGLSHRADVNAGDWVAVHGCGGVGLSAIHIADALGANVVAVDIRDEKLAWAESLGADETLNAAELDNVGSHVKAVTDGGADVSVDALGIADTCQNSIASLGRRGQHLQIGLTTSEEQGQITLPTDSMVLQEIEFLGSFGMQPSRFDEIFRMVERGKLEPGKIISETIGLADVNDRLQAMSDFGTVGIPVITEFSG